MKVDVEAYWIYGVYCFINLKVYRDLLKTVINMAKIELRHLCITDDGSYITANKFESKVSDYGVDFIAISICDENGYNHNIHLDKSTAIRFAKTVRTEINKIQ